MGLYWLDAQKLHLEPVPLIRKQEILDLLQEYLVEMAEYSGESVGGDGFFDDPHIDLYWQEDTRYPFFITLSDKVVGFVLVRRLEKQRQRVFHSIAEFYVQPAYRLQGIGRRAAILAFKRFPGWWHVAQEADNYPAQVFWQRVIHDLTGGEFRVISQPDWDGPVLEFYSG